MKSVYKMLGHSKTVSEIGKFEIELLLHLNSIDGWKNVRGLLKDTPLGQGALRTAIDNLLKYKFVIERKGNWNSRDFKISEVGKEAAEALLVVRRLTEMD